MSVPQIAVDVYTFAYQIHVSNFTILSIASNKQDLQTGIWPDSIPSDVREPRHENHASTSGSAPHSLHCCNSFQILSGIFLSTLIIATAGFEPALAPLQTGMEKPDFHTSRKRPIGFEPMNSGFASHPL